MGLVADRIAQLDVVVYSPDGNIAARLAGATGMSLKFQDGAYDDYTESTLEHQLLALSRLIFVARKRARATAVAEATGQPYETRTPTSPQEREFRERRDALESFGESENIDVVSSGSDASWFVRIQPGTVRELTEPQFLRELHDAVTACIRDMQSQIQALKKEVYGVRLPKWT